MLIPTLRTRQARVIAPAGALSEAARADVDAARDVIESRGIRVSFGAHTFGRHCYFSAMDLRRQQDFVSAVHDADVGIIWAARGGYGTAAALAALTSAQIASLSLIHI